MIFELMKYLSVHYLAAESIAKGIMWGMTVAGVAAMVSGVGSLVYLFWLAIKNVAQMYGKKVLISW